LGTGGRAPILGADARNFRKKSQAPTGSRRVLKFYKLSW
jgi:hypothetical protein